MGQDLDSMMIMGFNFHEVVLSDASLSLVYSCSMGKNSCFLFRSVKLAEILLQQKKDKLVSISLQQKTVEIKIFEKVLGIPSEII